MTNDDLIEAATHVLRPRMVKDRLFGDVGAALLSERGTMYKGVSIDTPGWGLCAERSAMAAMVTAGEYRLRKIVAVWKDMKSGALYVLPPCGICREFMRSVHEANLQAEIVLARRTTMLLQDLLPAHQWPEPSEG